MYCPLETLVNSPNPHKHLSCVKSYADMASSSVSVAGASCCSIGASKDGQETEASEDTYEVARLLAAVTSSSDEFSSLFKGGLSTSWG